MPSPKQRVQVGDVYGQLTVIEMVDDPSPGPRGAILRGRVVLVRCTCGKRFQVRARNLREVGGTRSCSTFCPARYQRVGP
jgi:hypothetical protein